MATRSAHRISRAPAAPAPADAVPGRPAIASPALNTAAYARFGPSLDTAPSRFTPQNHQNQKTPGGGGDAQAPGEGGGAQPVTPNLQRREVEEEGGPVAGPLPVRQAHPG